MNIYLSDKLKELRNQKNISQEKLAQYLNVSFQAVSKWENGNSYPDITLLPDIARFFDITVDELYASKSWMRINFSKNTVRKRANFFVREKEMKHSQFGGRHTNKCQITSM